MFRAAAKCPELVHHGHFNAPSSLRKGLPDIPDPAPGMDPVPGHPSCFAWMLQLKKKRNGIKFPSKRRNCRFGYSPTPLPG